MIEPTFEDELSRKAGETLAWLDNEYERGGINALSFRIALVAFDLATNGLAPSEYNEWASEARVDAQREFYPDKVVMTHPNGVTLVVELVRALGQIVVIQIGKKKTQKKTIDFEGESDSVKGAKDRFPKLIADLNKKGYEEVK